MSSADSNLRQGPVSRRVRPLPRLTRKIMAVVQNDVNLLRLVPVIARREARAEGRQAAGLELGCSLARQFALRPPPRQTLRVTRKIVQRLLQRLNAAHQRGGVDGVVP
jgi:hypothetical protein